MSRIPALAILLAGLTHGQSQPERFWLAGRYDGNRVIVYFDAVKFNRTVPADAQKIVQPVVDGFYDPVELPASYIAQFLNKPGAERFAIGDQYDLLTGAGNPVTITLTTLVGTEGDEQVGNDSYTGALATVERGTGLLPDQGLLCSAASQAEPEINHHRRPSGDGPASIQRSIPACRAADGTDENDRAARGVDATTEVCRRISQCSPFISLTAPYATMRRWTGVRTASGMTNLTTSSVHGLTRQRRRFVYLRHSSRASRQPNLELPRLRNVVDLGAGRTGLIVSIWYGEDSGALQLVEYRDGMSLQQMSHLHEIEAGE